MATRGRGVREKHHHVTSPLVDGVREPLDALRTSIHALLESAKTEGHSSSPELQASSSSSSSSSSSPLPRYQGVAQTVSKSCTKLAMLFSRPPTPSPEECADCTGQVEQVTFDLTTTFLQLCSSYHGKTLHREVEYSLQNILHGVLNLVTAIVESGSSSQEGGLQGTGTVWEHCDATSKISKDNKAAVVKVIISQLHLLKDAREEMEELEKKRGRSEEEEEWGEEEEEEEDIDGISRNMGKMALGGPPGGKDGRPQEWNDSEMELVKPCLQLVKISSDTTSDICKLILKSAPPASKVGVVELDTMSGAVLQLSPKVDDVVCELAAPLVWRACQEAAVELAGRLSHMLHTASSSFFCQAAGTKWAGPTLQDTVSVIVTQIKKTTPTSL